MTSIATPAGAVAAGGARSSCSRLVVAGAPGTGKGTLCPRLAAALGVPHISTGGLLRAEVQRRSALGVEVAATMARGALLPDALVLALVGNRLTQDDALDGFVLDGFPRTSDQARALCNLLGPAGLDLVVELVVPADEVVARLVSQRICGACGAVATSSAPGCECGGRLHRRTDADAATVQRRLAAYRCYTEPMLRWFERRGPFVRVDADRAAELVAARLAAVVAAPA